MKVWNSKSGHRLNFYYVASRRNGFKLFFLTSRVLVWNRVSSISKWGVLLIDKSWQAMQVVIVARCIAWNWGNSCSLASRPNLLQMVSDDFAGQISVWNQDHKKWDFHFKCLVWLGSLYCRNASCSCIDYDRTIISVVSLHQILALRLQQEQSTDFTGQVEFE